jgi:hypothetical protein
MVPYGLTSHSLRDTSGSSLTREEMMMTEKRSAEKTVRDIRRRTRKKYSAEEKIRIVLEGCWRLSASSGILVREVQ